MAAASYSPRRDSAPAQVTAYQAELARMDRDIEDLGPVAFQLPVLGETVTKYLYRIYQRAALRGDLEQLGPLEGMIDRAIGQVGPAEDLCLLKANLNFKLHRLVETKRAIETAPGLSGRGEGRSLLADIAFQEGRYAEARAAIANLVEEERTWDNLARLAHIEGKMGTLAAADALYAEAEDELTAKEMRSYAWVQLQRGSLDASNGDLDHAEEHFIRAGRAYSGFWLVAEHLAGVEAARHRPELAASLYEEVLKQVRRPEVLQKVGELYHAMGRTDKAERRFDEALAVYVASSGRGEVHYYHHLVDFFSSARVDPPECLRWARMDIALRDNFATQAALAWALYLSGQLQEAVAMIARSLESGVRDGQIFDKAAQIYNAAGMHEEGHVYSHKARALGHGGHIHCHG